jgi:glucose/arabinose dehydrogenase/PKD repeat protein
VSRRLACVGLVACAIALSLGLPAAGHASTVPAGFDDQVIALVQRPIGVAFTPDERMLIIGQLGQVWVYKNGVLNSRRAMNLNSRICTNVERGIIGIVVDPAFVDTHYVYLYYTYNRGNTACGTDQFDPANQPVNRVSRFVLGDDDMIDPDSEQVLIDNIPSVSGNHNAGDLHFGKDGYLYVSTGDGGCDYSGETSCGPWNYAARDHNVLLGKILRITSDGDVPQSNPFLGSGTARCNLTGKTTPGTWCQETYAWGLRNPFRIAFDPNAAGTRFFINDVGQEGWEEIDLGQAGADYGWNTREGPCTGVSQPVQDCGPPPMGMTNPIYYYEHSTGCTSLTGGAFVPNGLWPVAYEGSYLYMDLICAKIFALTADGAGGYTASDFATGIENPISMTFGPYAGSQALYYTSWTSACECEVHRLAYTGSANRAPKAIATADPTSGDLPLTLNFDASASTDPDGQDLTFDWDVGDGSPHAAGETASHTYTTAGIYTATVRVEDGSGGENSKSFRIDAGNNAPTPTIDTPLATDHFGVDEDIMLTGSATDPEDGALSSSALTWEVSKHHATHTHPFLPPTTGNDVYITGPQPEDFSAINNTYLEIKLTATDSNGLSRTVTRNLGPNIVDVGLATNPSGLQLQLNGIAAPASFTSWEGWQLTPNAPSPQFDSGGQGQTFASWSDNGSQQHTITTPSAPTTYTATFTKYYARPKGASLTMLPFVIAYEQCSSANRDHSAPLVAGSCNPPTQTSDYLTVGTGDVNGAAPQSAGRVRLDAVHNKPSTPADESDVSLNLSITDVRSASPGALDYGGELQASVDLRITDRLNGSPVGTDPATTVQTPLRWPIPCATTADTTVGSTCSLVTSANTLAPGTIVGGSRAIWQLDQFFLYDGGSDGIAATADNTLFATQGLFVP